MFTGIIEATATVNEVFTRGSNKSFWLHSPLAFDLKVDQSLSHNGVCLTVEEINDDRYRVTAIDETLKKSNLGDWQPGSSVNLERSLTLNSRLDGHFVQGHVDAVGICEKIKDKEGSHEIRIKFPKRFAELVIEKGSIALNGISLTVFDVKEKSFCVAIIPYTYDHTNMKHLKAGDSINIEFDMIGKYIARKAAV